MKEEINDLKMEFISKREIRFFLDKKMLREFVIKKFVLLLVLMMTNLL